MTLEEKVGVVGLTGLCGADWLDRELLRAAEIHVLKANGNRYQGLALGQIRAARDRVREESE